MCLEKTEYVQLEIIDRIAVVGLKRVDKKNCLNVDMRIKIGEIFEKLSENEEVKAVLIHGCGSNFCAGGDINEMKLIKSSYEAQALSQIEQNVFYRIQTCKKPVIAAIDGICFGAGFDLALSCDFRFITPNTKMGFPEIKLGIVVGGGGVNKLVRHVGLTLAKELLFTGRTMNAEELEEKNIVNKIVGDPYSYSIRYIKKYLFESSTNSIGEYKKVLHNTDISYSQMFSECNAIGECFKHYNREEGINAFIEKRKPRFV